MRPQRLPVLGLALLLLVSAGSQAATVTTPGIIAQTTAATFTVASVGTATVTGVLVTITPGAGLTIDGGTLTGGSCAALASTWVSRSPRKAHWGQAWLWAS